MPSTFPKRVIAAALYDALQSAAEKFGGIGSGEFYFNQGEGAGFAQGPVCLVGLLHYVGAVGKDVTEPAALMDNDGVIKATRALFGFGWGTSDGAVNTIRRELALPRNLDDGRNSAQPRVPFKKWAEYFNIQRAVELPAPVYDALKASAEKYAGIGCGGFGYGACPRCISGHALALDGYWEPRHPRAGRALDSFPTMVALAKAFDSDLSRNAAFKLYQENDRAVEAINERKGVHTSDRVTFEEFAEELNIVRVAVLAPNVYDALEASSAKFGGIGADAFDSTTYATDDTGQQVPYCVAGHAVFHDTDGADTIPPGGGTPTLLALQKAFNLDFFYEVYDVNDQAVFAINERKGAAMDARVTFAEWAQELRHGAR
jgi:hypothetical protein